MAEVLQAFPGARRALFRRYHIGGCSSCGFQPHESLAEVCSRYQAGPVEQVIDYIIQASEEEASFLIQPADLPEILKDGKTKLVDVRSKAEFDAVHLPGAIFLSPEVSRDLIDHPEQPVVFIDHQGQHVLDTLSYFVGHGLQQARALDGGIDRYAREVDPSLPRYRLEPAS